MLNLHFSKNSEIGYVKLRRSGVSTFSYSEGENHFSHPE
ncbi:Uncharacterized protein dnm_037690 [Desulfonema magnum]|uniref:Uncharacterized protein n=1 Tax=Desulfonema magnum TaxID=45655 RepID=A0A975GPB4_9BACT|nr:Uncharacterized protein dnm_037690 [Desulfonema magnum]